MHSQPKMIGNNKFVPMYIDAKTKNSGIPTINKY